MRRFEILLLQPLWLLAACCAACASSNDVRVATFNAGLAPRDVDHVDERAPHVIEALAGSEAQVLCVQEFWRTEDMEALREATRDRLPNAVRREPEPASTGCSGEELDPLQQCAERECTGLAGDDLAECALGNCSEPVGNLSGACLNCVIGAIDAGGDIAAIRSDCGGDGGEGYIYDGAFDNAILTSEEIVAQDSRVLDSYIVRASVEYAELATDAGPLHVFCTHLASGIGDFEYDGDYDSWKDEQAHQVEQVVAFVQEKTESADAAVLMGDLNNRPAVPAADMEAKWGDNYARLVEGEWTNPWVDDPNVSCTSCPDNTFHASDKPPTINDHVLVRGLSGGARCERAFTEKVRIEVDGEMAKTHLSDHYGLECKLSP